MSKTKDLAPSVEFLSKVLSEELLEAKTSFEAGKRVISDNELRGDACRHALWQFIGHLDQEDKELAEQLAQAMRVWR